MKSFNFILRDNFKRIVKFKALCCCGYHFKDKLYIDIIYFALDGNVNAWDSATHEDHKKTISLTQET